MFAFSTCKADAWLTAERVIAIFTVILGFATWFLWRATVKLVRSADDTAQRQLRAYVSVTPKEIISSGKEERFVQVTCALKNHGQTPAREIHYIFEFDIIPNPKPEGFVFSPPTIPIHADSSLFPQADMSAWFNFNRLLTTEEFARVEADTLRLHIWGKVFYRTAFGQQRHTEFNASVGGAVFIATIRAVRRNLQGPGFNWTWEAGHGHGD